MQMTIEEKMRLRCQAINKIVLVDLDETITYKSNFPDFGEINPDAVKTLKSWQEAGAYIIINTARVSQFWGDLRNKGKELLCPDYDLNLTRYNIVIWLQNNKIPFDSIWNNEGKCPCLFEIDDKALGCPKLSDGTLNWKKIWRIGVKKLRGYKYLEETQKFEKYSILCEGALCDKNKMLDKYFTKKEEELFVCWTEQEEFYDKEEMRVFKKEIMWKVWKAWKVERKKRDAAWEAPWETWKAWKAWKAILENGE